MKKIIILFVLILNMFTVVSCNKNEQSEELNVCGREQDFFNINVYYKENISTSISSAPLAAAFLLQVIV